MGKSEDWFGCVAQLVFLALGAVQLYAGYIGLDYLIESNFWFNVLFWGSLVLNLPIPIFVGCFYAARDLWEWHWALALLFTLPGIALSLGVWIAVIGGSLRERLARRR
jgi:hypothetical protein